MRGELVGIGLILWLGSWLYPYMTLLILVSPVKVGVEFISGALCAS